MEAMLARAQLDFTTPNTILILAVESENLIGNNSLQALPDIVNTNGILLTSTDGGAIFGSTQG